MSRLTKDEKDKLIRQALELRKMGVGYDRIARELGYPSAAAVRKQVESAIMAAAGEPARESLELELQRLDMAAFAIAQQVKAGHLGAIDRWLRIMERRAALLGLDKTRSRVEPGDGKGNDIVVKVLDESISMDDL